MLTQAHFTDGPITALKLGAQNMVLLNDPNVVRDLIEKRQANYSVRPDLWVRSFGDNLNIALREYDLAFSYHGYMCCKCTDGIAAAQQ